MHDAYLSVIEALNHAGYHNGAYVDIKWVNSEEVTEDNVADILADCQGVIVPGGFGDRGIEGMIVTAGYCRTHNVPYLGICLGMQVEVIEFARNVLGYTDANSGEFDTKTPHKVIDFLPDQHEHINKGGTLRLGSYPCVIKKGSKMAQCYGCEFIHERHRHRYEFVNEYREEMEKAGMNLVGTSPDNYIVEAIEFTENDFYIGVQFHPELKSRPNKPGPLFTGLVARAVKRL